MKAVLLDRDETLNFDPGYISDPDLIRLKPGVAEGLSLLRDAGYIFFILTNQSGVGRGLISREQLESVHRRLKDVLAESQIEIKKIYFCPHTDEDNCDCRKPHAGMVRAALKEFSLNADDCFLIGDRLRDIIPGEELNIPGIMVYSSPHKDDIIPSNLIYIARDLKDAADFVLSRENQK